MPTPLDMLIGPSLRYSQGPREGEVPGSRQPYSPVMATAGAFAAVIAIGWAVRTLSRRGNDI